MRLGDTDTGGEGGSGNVASAYGGPQSGGRSRTLLFIFVAALILLFLKNSFTKDYRGSTKDYLTKAGVDEEKINKVVPKTYAEYQKEKMNEKEKVEWLMNQVTVLESRLNATVEKYDAQIKDLQTKLGGQRRRENLRRS